MFVCSFFFCCSCFCCCYGWSCNVNGISTLVVPFACKTNSFAVWIIFIWALKVSCGSLILLLFSHNLHYEKVFLFSLVTGQIFTEAYPSATQFNFPPVQLFFICRPTQLFVFQHVFPIFTTIRHSNEPQSLYVGNFCFPFPTSSNFYRSILFATTNEMNSVEKCKC